MDKTEIEKVNSKILELVNASAQSWQKEKESLQLLYKARELAIIQNRHMEWKLKYHIENSFLSQDNPCPDGECHHAIGEHD